MRSCIAAMRLFLAAFLLLLGLAAGLAACKDAPRDASPLPAGAPTLRRADLPVRSNGADATLTLASPARVQIVYRRDGAADRILLDVQLPGGKLIEFGYTSGVAQPPGARASVPPPEEQAAQRTEMHPRVLQLTVDGFLGALTLDPTVWTRPGLAQARTHILAPSRLGEKVPFDTDVELITVAVADVESGELSLRPRDGKTIARVDPPLGGEDRLHVMRLILRVESVGGGRSERP